MKLPQANLRALLKIDELDESPCSKLQGIKAGLIIPPHPNPLPRERKRTYVRCSEHEIKRNAEIGFFTKPPRL